MFQLIVSVIAIALVAILAAASIYYGGSAFTSSNTKGAVAALINSGEQIAGANALYKVDNTVGATTMTALEPVYLAGDPTPPKFASGAWSIDATGTVATINLSATSASQVCTEVGNQGGSKGAALTKVFGCVGDDTAGWAFQYRL